MDFKGRNVLITGGTGSLGRKVLERAVKEDWGCNFTIFSKDETRQSLLKSQYPQHRYVLGDIAIKDDLRRAIWDVDTVLHFAAYKQVPSSQVNVSATINTNVIGSRNVAEIAVEYGVERVVASSTDKACAPVNAYGVSKSLMESLFQEANHWGITTFHLARYGNVVCSNASVIPLFIKQKSNGGPLTVTNFDMTRFWISLDQAVDLILLALDSPKGTIVVPQAPAMSVFDLAKAIGGDLGIVESGVRPGEKIHEAMIHKPESIHTEVKDDYFLIYPPTAPVYDYQMEEFEYTSDNPRNQLTKDQILNMIRAEGFDV